MNFQVPTTKPATTGAQTFSFGLPTAASGAKLPSLGFDGNTTVPQIGDAATSLAFGSPAPTKGITGIGDCSGNTATTSTAASLSGFAFGTTTAPIVTSTASTLPTLKGFAIPTSTAAQPSQLGGGGLGGFSVGTTATTIPGTATAQPALNSSFGATPTAATMQPSLPVLTGFGASPASKTTAATTEFALPKTTSVPTLSLGGQGTTVTVVAPAPTSAATTTTGNFISLTTATKATDSANLSNIPKVTYKQLEEHINKWTLELEEQEKVFTEQATQINAWDRILMINNEKILELNDAVKKVKTDQKTVEQDLEFILTQHKELEESIVPLQKEFLKLPQVDVERSQTYLIAENLDTQLNQMSENLKEIIENLNEANKGQNNTDPIIQVGKILNAHMNSLQLIEASSANIANKIEEINKMHESLKRDSERSFRSAYYN